MREPTLNELLREQEERAVTARGQGTLHSLLHAGETWTVAATAHDGAVPDGESEELGAGGE